MVTTQASTDEETAVRLLASVEALAKASDPSAVVFNTPHAATKLLFELAAALRLAKAEMDGLRTRLAAAERHAEAMRQAGWEWKGIVDDLAHVVATHHTAVQSLIDRARVAADTPKENG